MDFLNLPILAGLAVAAMPVIIHLLNRRRARVIDWGAMRFLEMSLASRGRRVLLEEVLLLVLRTVLLAGLVLAMARPLLVNRHFAAGSAGQDVVIILDASMSMGVVPSISDFGLPTVDEEAGKSAIRDPKSAIPGPSEPDTYFARARQAALHAVGRLAPGDAVAVVQAGAAPRRLTGALTFDRESARSAIRRARLTDAACDVPAALSLAARILQGGQNAHKQIVLITDGRSHGWRTESADDWESLAVRLASAARAPRVRVLALACGVQGTGGGGPAAPAPSGGERTGPAALSNLAIEQVRLSRPVVGTDLPVVLTVTVRNTGQVEAGRGVRLTLRPGPGERPIDGQALPEISPMARQDVQLQAHFARPGTYRLVFELDAPDALAADNQLIYALQVLPAVPVLLVNGEPSAVPDQDECFWLRSAFQPSAVSREDQPIEFLVRPTVVEPALLAAEDLNRYDAIVLANVERLDEPMRERLSDYVRAGGGLLVAPGARADREWYNQVLFDEGRGLLPAALGEPIDLRTEAAEPLDGRAGLRLVTGDPADPKVTIGAPPQGHPALIGSAEPTMWQNVRLFRRYPLAPAEGDQVAVVLRLSSGAVYAAEKRRGGATADTGGADGRGGGRGRVILLGGPLDADWSTAPLHQAFVVLVNELVYYLAAPRLAMVNIAPGGMLLAPAPDPSAGVAASVRTPDGRHFALTRVFENGRWGFPFGQTAEPGVYEVRFSGGESDRGEASSDRDAADAPDSAAGSSPGPATRPDGSVLYFTVQRDPGESLMSMLEPDRREELGRRLGGGIEFHDEPSALLAALKVTDPGREIWKWLAAAVLVMLLVEVWLTRRITRGRHGDLTGGVRFGQPPMHTVR